MKTSPSTPPVERQYGTIFDATPNSVFLYMLRIEIVETRWWFQIFFYVHPYLVKISNFTNIFQMGWNHQPENGWLIGHI